MTTLRSTLAALAAAAALPAAQASDSYYDYARVVDVEPIYTTRYISEPREECEVREYPAAPRHISSRYERYDDYRYRSPQPNAGAALIGGLIGGALGHGFGDGNDRKWYTLAGAAVGATVGHRVSRHHNTYHHPDYGYRDTYTPMPRTERHCRVVEDVREVEELDHYRVKYQYKGKTFVKLTEEDPGERIRVRVQVDPYLAAAEPGAVFRLRSSGAV